MNLSNSHTRPLLLTLVLSLLVAPVCWGQEQTDSNAEETKKTVAMSERIYKKLQQAQEHVLNEEYAEAHQILEATSKLKNLTDYERAQIWNLDAYNWYLQQNYPEAIKSYEQITNYTELPEALVQSTLKTLAQLYFTIEDYNKALVKVQEFIRVTPEPDSDTYMLLGQTYYQLKQYKEAVAPIEKAVAIQAARNENPEENQLLLLRAIHYELKDYKAMLRVLEDLVRLYPNDSYTLTIAGIYSELGDTKKQLTLTEALYEKGAIPPEKHALNLANLYLLHKLPYKAALVLEKEIKSGAIESSGRNLRLLSQAWYQARNYEKSIPPLRQAAERADNGELYVRLGQSYSNLERWQEAAAALQQALEKGRLKNTGQTRVMLGVALFNENRFKDAAAVFRKVEGDKRSKTTAAKWLSYIEEEQQRRAILKAGRNQSPAKADQTPVNPS